jgi:hypothetical protein
VVADVVSPEGPFEVSGGHLDVSGGHFDVSGGHFEVSGGHLVADADAVDIESLFRVGEEFSTTGFFSTVAVDSLIIF